MSISTHISFHTDKLLELWPYQNQNEIFYFQKIPTKNKYLKHKF